MSYVAAFLAAIQEAPDDDAPRLVYADWLDEQGDAARAEFVRVQCELARLDEDDDRCPALEDRERALWKKHGKAWRQPLAPFSNKFAFKRGFAEEVLVAGRTFVDHAAEVFSAAPLFAVRLRAAKNCIDEVAACPYLERLTSFSLYWNNIGQGRAEVFFRSPHLHRLTSLDMRTNAIRAGGVGALVGARLDRLTSLSLEDNELGDAGPEALAGSELLSRLTTLDLSRNNLTAAGVRALADSPAAVRLAELDLSANADMGDAAAVALASSRHLGGLRRLAVSTHFSARRRAAGRPVGVTPAGASALAASGLFGRLTRLRLDRNEYLGDAGLAAIAAAGRGQLAELDLSFCRIGDAGLEALASSSLLTGLRELTLEGGNYTAAGVKALVSSPHAGALRELRLLLTPIGDKGARTLAEAPHVGSLRALDLGHCGLTDSGVAALAASPHLSGLRRLDLTGNAFDEGGARALARSPHLGRLRSLGVPVAPSQKAAFRSRPGWDQLFARFGDVVS